MTQRNRRIFIPTLTGLTLLSIILCLTLAASAFALFFDQVSNSGNRMETGTLSSSFWYSEQLTEDGSLENRKDLSDSTNKLFGERGWTPGQKAVRYLQVENTGTLPLSYSIVFDTVDDGLGEYLTFTIRPVGSCRGTVALSSASDTTTGAMLPNAEIYNASLPPGNSTQEIYEITCTLTGPQGVYGRSTPNLHFSLNVHLIVMQTGVPQPGGVVLAYSWSDLSRAEPFGTILLMRDIDAGQRDVLWDCPVNLDLNGHTLTVKSLHMADDRTGTVGLISGGIIATGTVPGSKYGVIIDTPQANVHFSDYTGTVLVNGVLFMDGLQQDTEPPPEVDGVYRIETEQQLIWLSDQVSSGNSFAGKEFQLLCDIDLRNQDWTPIGGGTDGGFPFSGVFDGNGFVVRSLSIHGDASGFLGFFGALDGTVRNLNLDGVSIQGSNNIGAIAGTCNGSLERCTVKNTSITGQSNLGGLTGFSGGDITGCSVLDTEITGTGGSVGGLSGATSEGETKLTDCLVSGCAVSACLDTGGLVGWKNCGTGIYSCEVNDSRISIDSGSLDQPAYCGGLIGRASEWYLSSPDECDAVFAQNVSRNRILEDVTVTAAGVYAYANHYNSYTGTLDCLEW